MTEWIVKDKGYVPLPQDHVLRNGVDLVLWRDSWLKCFAMNGQSWGTVAHAKQAGYTNACCLVEDWPKERGPVPQEPGSEPDFRVDIGKRYVARNGQVTGPLATNTGDREWPFFDPKYCRSYRRTGRYRYDYAGFESTHDLVAEYTEPQPGQWLVSDGGDVWRCAAVTDDGDAVLMNCDRFLVLHSELTKQCQIHHEPACTGFGWTPPAEPSEPTVAQEIIESLTEYADDLERESRENQERTIAELRSQCERQAGTIEILQAQIESDNRWIEALQNKQIAELKPAQPAEDPEEWVVQDRVPMRDCDERRWVDGDTGLALMTWQTVDAVTSVKPAVHGAIDLNGNRLELRCRRKDLPPLPSPDPPKTRTIPMAVVMCSNDGECWVEARVSMRDGKPCVPSEDVKVIILEEYAREIGVCDV